MDIIENIKTVNEQIKSAAKRAERDAKDITLVAVSKTKPVSDLGRAYEAGVRDFGENRVQELLEKIPQMPDDVRWHMIGHLQRNKVASIIDKVYAIHSVDSFRLAHEISICAGKAGVRAKVFLEVNVAKEASKYGEGIEYAPVLYAQIKELPNIEILGFMTIAPYVSDGEENRKYFKELREFCDKLAKESGRDRFLLSMGMSGDFETAVEEGADFVRVGSKIFGDR